MLRFLLLTLTVCLGCALTIGAAVAVGRTQPPSEAVRWFHMDDCEQPCFMGVTLGKTSFDEAKMQFEKILSPAGYTMSLEASNAQDSGIIQLHLVDTNSVKELVVEVVFSNSVAWKAGTESYDRFFPIMPTLADMISLYGAPVCVGDVESQNPYRMAFFLNHEVIIAAVIYQPVKFDSLVDTVLYSPTLDDRLCGCPNWRDIAVKHPQIGRGCDVP